MWIELTTTNNTFLNIQYSRLTADYVEPALLYAYAPLTQKKIKKKRGKRK